MRCGWRVEIECHVHRSMRGVIGFRAACDDLRRETLHLA